MTSPVIVSLNPSFAIELPNDKLKVISLFVEDENFDVYKGQREVVLQEYRKYHERLGHHGLLEEIHEFEEVFNCPETDTEFLGDYSEEKIIQSFHSDNVEFI